MSNIIIVLFNLKEKRNVSDYEAWAKSTDLPIVRDLASVDSFDVLKSIDLLGSTDKPPYEYVEIIKIKDFELFGKEVSTEIMQSVANQFQAFADNPIFINTMNIESPDQSVS